MVLDMKKILLSLALIFSAWTVQSQDCGPFEFPNYNLEDSTEANAWGTDLFVLSDAYPAVEPEAPKGGYPWAKIDFRRKPMDFMQKVLDYCWEGMPEANFVGDMNESRTWFNAPWLDYGYAGREFLRGLRMDRTSGPGELASGQKDSHRNYSITYYNAPAGYALGQVWCDPSAPDASKAKFPVGSVIYKMVFTMADTSDVPHLDGTIEWEAFVEEETELPIGDKQVRKVRLIEVDYMVRSASADAVNGWVFGSHIFDGRIEGNAPKDKLVPVGLQWGNDPEVTPAQVREGEKPLEQTWINTKAWNQDDLPNSAVQSTGWGFRLQGVVGNHATSMMAEAMTASWPVMSSVPPGGITPDSMLHWHRNLPSGTPFNADQASLAYSLELRDGIRNWTISTKEDSIMNEEYKAELAEMLAFVPPTGDQISTEEEEEEVIEFDEGLTGRNLFVFIGFILLVVALGVLLVMNLIKKS